jgi:hypothetical protein
MDAETNYWLIWLIYCLACGAFYWVYWKMTRIPRSPWLSYSLRALMLSLMLTPWYANIEGNTLAPALMVLALDIITIGGGAAGRALVPLLTSLMLAEAVATGYYFLQRKSKKTVKTES